jgi:urease accessory protein
MTDLPPVARLLKTASDRCYDVVVLTYDERLVRRKRLKTVHDEGFLVDLPEVTNLDLFWGFELEDGRAIQVLAAEEAVLEVTGPDLARYAWHIGNRHTPCQVEVGRLVIRADHVLEAMLRQLGANVTARQEPFAPEVGAYGVGRPMGHDHEPAHPHGHDHGADHSHDHHDHDHSLDHGHGHHHRHSPAVKAPVTQS